MLSSEDRQALGRAVGDAARTAQRAEAELDDAVASFFGINATDARAMDLLQHYGRMTAGELAEHLKVSSGAVTAIVDRLEGHGAVERVRDENDRRRVYIATSQAAASVGDALYAPFIDAWRRAADAFTDDELRSVLKYLETARVINSVAAAQLREVELPGDASHDVRLRAARAFSTATVLPLPGDGAPPH